MSSLVTERDNGLNGIVRWLRGGGIWRKCLFVGIYLSSVVLANLIVAWFGPAASVFTAFVAIGFSITGRDALHDVWRGRNLKRNLALLIAMGSIITVLFNTGAWRIALASTVAFVVSMLADSLVYHPSRNINLSNAVSAAVDSVLFPCLAFGALLPWVIVGQFTAKVLGGALWLLGLRVVTKARSQPALDSRSLFIETMTEVFCVPEPLFCPNPFGARDITADDH